MFIGQGYLFIMQNTIFGGGGLCVNGMKSLSTFFTNFFQELENTVYELEQQLKERAEKQSQG